MSELSPNSEVVRIPDMGDADAEGLVAATFIKPGQFVETGQTLLEVETDKVVLEIPSEFSGIVDAVLINVGDRIKEGAEFARITRQAPEASVANAEPIIVAVETQSIDANKESGDESLSPMWSQTKDKPAAIRLDRPYAAAGPAARRLARELGVPIASVPGTGHRGRISKSDVKSFVKQKLTRQAETGMSVSVWPLPGEDVLGPNTRKHMTSIQRTTSRNMRHSASRVPHAWLQEKIDITELEAGRVQLKEVIAADGGALTLTAILCKCLAQAVKEFPIFNSVLDDERDEVIYRHAINIGVAVDTPRGLLVPVLSNASNMSLSDISRRLSEIGSKSRNVQLTAGDLRGASITISNLGGIGTSGIFPIINWPEVAILGVGAGAWIPSYRDGDVTRSPEPRLMLPVTLAFDHRLINGADGARLLQSVKGALERPLRFFSDRL